MTREDVMQAAYEGVMKAFRKLDQISENKSDLISKNEAYRLRKRARVDRLIDLGLLPTITSGRNIYVSEKRLFELDKYII